MNYLYALPRELAVLVLSDWLTHRNLGMVDAACCSKNFRERFHELLSSKELTIHYSVKEKHWSNYAAWHIKRKTKMSRLVLPSNAETSEPEALAQFLRSVGGPHGVHLKVLSVHLHLQKSCVEHGVCNLFHLQELSVQCSTDMKVIDALVRNSAQSLRKLTFSISNTSAADDVYFAKCDFHRLSSLSVSWCNRFDIPLIRMLSTTAKLQNVSITGSDRLSDDMYHLLLTRNPRLKSMCFANCPGLTSDVLRSAAPTLRELERVEFEYCRLLDVTAITALATHCSRLRYVCLRANSSTFLVRAVEVLVKYCGESLENLSVDGYNNVSVRCLQALGTSCTALQTLSLPAYEVGMLKRLPARDVVRFRGTELPALRSLGVRGNYVDDQSLAEISRACGNLRRLDLRSAWGYTAAGAQALVQSARQLREVVVTRSEHLPCNTEIVALWKEVAALTQPPLKITAEYA